jgi:hypothetical protein
MSFSQAEFADKKKTTRREKFLAHMEEIIPWQSLLGVIEPFYPKGERGRPPVGLERMLRMYFLQQWYGLADEALEDAIYDSQAMQGFIRIDLGADGVPDATTLLKSNLLVPAGKPHLRRRRLKQRATPHSRNTDGSGTGEAPANWIVGATRLARGGGIGGDAGGIIRREVLRQGRVRRWQPDATEKQDAKACTEA